MNMFKRVLFIFFLTISANYIFSDAESKYKDFKYIYGEGKGVTKDNLRDYMIKVIKENPSCEPQYVDQSVNDKSKYFLMCGNMKKIYWTKEDMKSGATKKTPKHLSESAAITQCENIAKSNLTNPFTFSRNFWGTNVAKAGNARSIVTMKIKAKNKIGNQATYSVECLVGNGASDLVKFEQI